MLVVDFALDWLAKYEKLPSGNNTESIKQNMEKNAYYWSGKSIELLEMALSVHAAKKINDGDISQKSVVDLFFRLFGIKPGNFSSTYGVMRTRVDSRTIFIDKLKEALEEKMDKDDQRIREK